MDITPLPSNPVPPVSTSTSPTRQAFADAIAARATTAAPAQGPAVALPAPPVEPSEHPFSLLAQGKGLGEVLGDLAKALASPSPSNAAVAQELARALDLFALTPGQSGQELAKLVASSGLLHEARTLGAALDKLPPGVLSTAADEIVTAAMKALGAKIDTAVARAALSAQLAVVVSDPEAMAALLNGQTAGGDAARVADKTLMAAITTALARSFPDVDPAVREEIAGRLALAKLSPRLAQAVLVALLGERALQAQELAAPKPAITAGAADLKQWLASAMAKLGDGAERNAARVALHAVEVEQIVALARANLGDGASWGFAVHDGSGYANAHLVHRRTQERQSGPSGGSEEPTERAVLGIAFSRTGPVRADFALDTGALRVRLLVSREEVADRMNATLDELRTQLEALGRSVQLQIGVRPAEELRVPEPAADVRLADGRSAVDVVA